MRVARSRLLRSLVVLAPCFIAFPAAAGSAVRIQVQRTNPSCDSVAQYDLTAVSFRSPPLVSLKVVDINSGAPATLTLGSSSTERSYELTSLATLMSVALRISQQQTQASNGFMFLSSTCDSTLDIHGSDWWTYSIQLFGELPRFQVLLGAPHETFLVQYYSMAYGSMAYGDAAGLSRTVAMSQGSGPRLEMGTTAPLYFNLQQAVRVAQHVASGHPYIFLTSYAQLDTDGWYRDPTGLQSTSLYSSYAGPP